jgi:hypothetical protein
LTGKRQQKWRSGFKTKRDAERAMREAIGRLEQGTYVEPSRQTVAEYMREWLKGVRVRPSTLESYTMNVESRIIPLIGHVRVQSLTPQVLDAFYRDLEESGGRRKSGLSSRSVRYAHTILRKAIADGVRKGVLVHNVADKGGPAEASAPGHEDLECRRTAPLPGSCG